MRAAFIRGLVELAEQDERIVLITGDLGFMAIEPFAEAFPDRFFNAGVAEQNMLGLATGLADSGRLPFVYSIATFATLRPYEFIRNGPVLQGLPVRIVGVGGGFEYGPAGPTHFGLEDIGVMRLQPGMTVLAPADHQQARTALLRTWDLPEPIYYRVGKNDRDTLPGLDGAFRLGGLELLREGPDLLILATGAIALQAAAAAEELARRGWRCSLAVAACLAPTPEAELLPLLRRHELIMTVEAHYVTGGLGSLICELVAEHGLGCRVLRRGVRELPSGVTGSEAYLNDLHGLSSAKLVEAALEHRLEVVV